MDTMLTLYKRSALREKYAADHPEILRLQAEWQLHVLHRDRYTEDRCYEIWDLMQKIKALKAERQAVILAHSYVASEVQAVADKVSDSYALSLEALATKDAKVIVFAGVHFMAETAKILNPEKIVLMPDRQAGCSLAESAEDDIAVAEWIDNLRAQHPDLAVVTYINSTAAVKALSDVIITSSNARRILEKLPNKHIAFLPDKFMGAYFQEQMPEKTFYLWPGTCMVHEQITPEEYQRILAQWPNAVLVTHLEAPLQTSQMSHFVGSTTAMLNYAEGLAPGTTVVLGTACGVPTLLRQRLAKLGKERDLKVVGGCYTCPHMERNTIEGVYRALLSMQPEINVDTDTAQKALKAINRMIELAAEP
jgi:quinolinate synthase